MQCPLLSGSLNTGRQETGWRRRKSKEEEEELAEEEVEEEEK